MMKSPSPSGGVAWSHVDSSFSDEAHWVESSISLSADSSCTSMSSGTDSSAASLSLRQDSCGTPECSLRADDEDASQLRVRRSSNRRLLPLISSASGLRRTVSASDSLCAAANQRPSSPGARLGQPAACLLSKSTYDLDQRLSVLTLCMQKPRSQAVLDVAPESPTTNHTFAGEIIPGDEALKPVRSAGTNTPPGTRLRRGSSSSGPFHRHSIGICQSRKTQRAASSSPDPSELASRLPPIRSGSASGARQRKSLSTSSSPIGSATASPATSPSLETKAAARRSVLRHQSSSPRFSPLVSPMCEDGPPVSPRLAFGEDSVDVRSRLASPASTYLCVPRHQASDPSSRRSQSCPTSPAVTAAYNHSSSVADAVASTTPGPSHNHRKAPGRKSLGSSS